MESEVALKLWSSRKDIPFPLVVQLKAENVELEAVQANVPPSVNAAGSSPILSALLSQAINDTMGGITLGIAKDRSPFMRYSRMKEGSHESWEMTPPPGWVIVELFRFLVAYVELEPVLPIRGEFRTEGRFPRTVCVTITGLDQFSLIWDRELSNHLSLNK